VIISVKSTKEIFFVIKLEK